MPESRRDLQELLQEAKYYLIQVMYVKLLYLGHLGAFKTQLHIDKLFLATNPANQ